MTEPRDEERRHLIRSLRQQLEALRRAGLDRIRFPAALLDAQARPATAPAPVAVAVAPRPAAIPTSPTPPPAPPPPSKPAPAPKPAPALATSLFDDAGLDAPIVPEGERPAVLAALAEEIAACTRCPILVANRTRTVPGEGSPTARLMFVGEAPGQTEDETGRPFVGRAGALLTDMIVKGMGLAREDVFIANTLKCRPPENRDPAPDEVRNCRSYLERQIAAVRPEFLCILGSPAAKALLETALGVTRLRGKWHRYRGIPAIVTWHPAYLLRNPAAKKDTWEDLQMLMRAMGLKPPGRKKG